MSTALLSEAKVQKQAAEVVERLRHNFDAGVTRPLSYRQEQLGGLRALSQGVRAGD